MHSSAEGLRRVLAASLLPVLAFLLIGPGLSRAAKSARPLDLFELAAPTFTAFTASSGVPEAVIWDVAVDRNQFVWLSSPNGMARYDGHSWEREPGPDPGVNAYQLLHDHQGIIWATLNVPGVAGYDGERWHMEGTESGLPAERLNRLMQIPAQDGPLELWALSFNGTLLRRVEERWNDESGSNIPRDLLYAVARTQEITGGERLWLATGTEGLWYRDRGGEWRKESRLDAGQINDLLVSRNHGQEELWIATFGRGLWRLTRNGFTSWTTESGDLPSNMMYDLQVADLPNGERVLWASSRSGLVCLHGDRIQVFDRRHGLPSNGLRAMQLWRSPSGFDVLWIATESGVARLILGASPWYTASLLGSSSVGVFGVVTCRTAHARR